MLVNDLPYSEILAYRGIHLEPNGSIGSVPSDCIVDHMLHRSLSAVMRSQPNCFAGSRVARRLEDWSDARALDWSELMATRESYASMENRLRLTTLLMVAPGIASVVTHTYCAKASCIVLGAAELSEAAVEGGRDQGKVCSCC